MDTEQDEIENHIRKGDFEKIKIMVENNTIIKYTDYDPKILLGIDLAAYHAILYNKLEIAKYLVERGANVNKALQISGEMCNLRMIKYLTEEKKADINYDSVDSVLYCGARYGYLSIVQYLIENYDIKSYQTALYKSAKNGHLEIIKLLVEKNVHIHAENDFALRVSVENDHLDVVKYLLTLYSNDTIVYILNYNTYDDLYNSKLFLHFLTRNNPTEYPSLIMGFRNIGIDIFDLIEKEY